MIEVNTLSLREALEYVRAEEKRLENESKGICGLLYDDGAELPFVLLTVRFEDYDNDPWYIVQSESVSGLQDFWSEEGDFGGETSDLVIQKLGEAYSGVMGVRFFEVCNGLQYEGIECLLHRLNPALSPEIEDEQPYRDTILKVNNQSVLQIHGDL